MTVSTQKPTGKLVLVGVPIGNLDDMTFRAVDSLRAADVIAAEDTRKARKLLTHFNIKPPRLMAHGAHNEQASTGGLVGLMQSGQTVAYVTDSGMPGVSDPGFLLSRSAREAGIEVEVVPGVSAVTTAVLASGLPCDQFTFAGFLPRQKKARQTALQALAGQRETLVFYEAPHRVLASLGDMVTVLGDRPGALCRELTKRYEEILPGCLSDIQQALMTRDEILGEITLVVAGISPEAMIKIDEAEVEAAIMNGLAAGKPLKALRDEIADTFSISRRDAYDMASKLKRNKEM